MSLESELATIDATRRRNWYACASLSRLTWAPRLNESWDPHVQADLDFQIAQINRMMAKLKKMSLRVLIMQ